MRPVGDALSVAVAPDTALSVEVPSVGTISGPVGAFSSTGTITIHGETATFAADSGLDAAGPGVDVAFQGTELRKPLTVVFDAHPGSDPDAIPVVAHQGDDGSWDVRPATRDAQGRFTITTSSFSLNIPSWANPLAWWRSLTAKIASAAGGRTSPLNCSGAPGWFHLDAGHSDLVHVCAKSNRTSDGQDVAEVQIKSNRGVSVEVTVPGAPAYVWVENQPWPWRQAVATALHFDPNRTVILPAGATMTVGYPRSFTSGPVSFFVTGTTAKAAADTFIRDIADFALSENNYTFIGYSEVKCATGLNAGATGVTIGVANIKDFLSCWTGQVAGELQDRGKALQVASQFGGSSQGVDALVKHAKAAKALGWLVTLWPAFQLGLGNVIDKIRELITDGQTALVTYHMDLRPIASGGSNPPPATAPPGGHTSTGPGAGPTTAPPQPPPPPATHAETTGGVTHTWTNYTNAGGTAGPTIASNTTVQISCKLTGFRVADGNTWWYRIASPGWDNHFYASADAFYNNGQTSGTLHGTPWVDNAVPDC